MRAFFVRIWPGWLLLFRKKCGAYAIDCQLVCRIMIVLGVVHGLNWLTQGKGDQMASTAVTLHNESDTNIYAELKWGLILVDKAEIPAKQKGHLGCEYVWYDLYVFKDTAEKPLLAQRNGVYGYSSWVFQKNAAGGYEIVPD